MKAVLQSLFCSLSLTSKRTTSTWGLNDPVVSLALNPTACAGSLPYSYTVQRMQQHPSCTYQCIGIKLQPCLTSISNTDLVKVDHSQAILAFLSTSCLPRFLFWCSMQSASHSLLRCSVQHRIAWKAAGCSQIRTDFALVFFLMQNITVSVFALWEVWVRGKPFAFISCGSTWFGEKRKKIADCLPGQLRVENSSAAISDSTWVTVKSKVRHTYKSSWQSPNFILSIIRLNMPPRGLPCKFILLVPLWSQAASSLSWHDCLCRQTY